MTKFTTNKKKKDTVALKKKKERKKINLFLGHVTQLVGSQFTDQGWNLGPQQWKLGVLTSEKSGNSTKLIFVIFKFKINYFKYPHP